MQLWLLIKVQSVHRCFYLYADGSDPRAAIAGGVVGGIIVIAIAVVLVLVLKCMRNRLRSKPNRYIVVVK